MQFNPFELITEKLNDLQQQVAAISPTSTITKTEIISRDELCQRLRITEPTIIRWQRKGKIPFIQIGSSIRYNWYSVLEALEKKAK